MSNSSLVVCKNISPNQSGKRKSAIDRITPHCVCGQCTAESLGSWFAKSSTQASSNYGIDKDGRIGMYVEESCRSWCTSSSENDNRAVTIECASDVSAPYRMNECVFTSLVLLCTDICKRNGKKKLIWINDKTKALNYKNASDEMLITVHRWYSSKSCPGDWLYNRLGELAEKVTAALSGMSEEEAASKKTINPAVKSNMLFRVVTDDFGDIDLAREYADKVTSVTGFKGFGVFYDGMRFSQFGAFDVFENALARMRTLNNCKELEHKFHIDVRDVDTKQHSYLVRVTTDCLNVRKGPGTDYPIVGEIRDGGVYTILSLYDGEGSPFWGKLKSGIGYIAMYYTEAVK